MMKKSQCTKRDYERLKFVCKLGSCVSGVHVSPYGEGILLYNSKICLYEFIWKGFRLSFTGDMLDTLDVYQIKK